MFLIGHKLEMLRIHAELIKADVMNLPPPGPIWARLNRNGSVRFGPSNPVGVFWFAATRETDCRVAALAGTASVPFPARGYGVDGVFAFQARGSTESSSSGSHVLCPHPARRPEG